jgi:outer membrane protein TolC
MELITQIAALDLRTHRPKASVTLIQALSEGWENARASPPQA